MRMKYVFLGIAAVFTSTIPTGCANVKPTETGFLHDYRWLIPTSARLNWGGGAHKVAVRSSEVDDLAGVDSFYIEPVSWLAPENDWVGKDCDRRKRVSAVLEKSLKERFGRIRPIVAAPGPNTATVRAAVTDVDSARVFTNILFSVVWGPISNGGSTVEAEILAPDGRQIAAVDGASAGGPLDITGYYFRSGHARKSTRRLAGELEKALEPSVAALKTQTPAIR